MNVKNVFPYCQKLKVLNIKSLYSILTSSAGTVGSGNVGVGTIGGSLAALTIPSATATTKSNTTTSGITPPTSITTFLPKIYYHGDNILPFCGVQSDNGSISFICEG